MPSGPGADFNPGDFVYLPLAEDWGIGQVQYVLGHRVTVKFKHQGKPLMDTEKARLLPVDMTDS